MQVIQGYPGAELVWCQEEPKNMGAWTYVKPRLETALRDLSGSTHIQQLHYVGRPTAASTGDTLMFEVCLILLSRSCMPLAGRLDVASAKNLFCIDCLAAKPFPLAANHSRDKIMT